MIVIVELWVSCVEGFLRKHGVGNFTESNREELTASNIGGYSPLRGVRAEERNVRYVC